MDEDKGTSTPSAPTDAAEPASNPPLPPQATLPPPTPLPYPARYEYAVRWYEKYCPQDTFPKEDKLVLWALNQQATIGSNNTNKPSMWTGDAEETAKWNCWTELDKMDKMEAMRLFVKAIESEAPDWQTTPGLLDDDGVTGEDAATTSSTTITSTTTTTTTGQQGNQDTSTSHTTSTSNDGTMGNGSSSNRESGTGVGGAPVAHVTGGIPPPLPVNTTGDSYRRPTVQRVLNQSAKKKGNRPGVLVDANARLQELEASHAQTLYELQERMTRIQYENELVQLRDNYGRLHNENTQMRAELEKFAAWMRVYPNGVKGGMSWNPMDWISYIFSIGGRSSPRDSHEPPPPLPAGAPQFYRDGSSSFPQHQPQQQQQQQQHGYNQGLPPPGSLQQAYYSYEAQHGNPSGAPPLPTGEASAAGRYEAEISVVVDGDNAV